METDAGKKLKKLIETPVQLGWINPRGLGVIDGQTVEDRARKKLNSEGAEPTLRIPE